MIETTLHSPILITTFVGVAPIQSAIVVSRIWQCLSNVERPHCFNHADSMDILGRLRAQA